MNGWKIVFLAALCMGEAVSAAVPGVYKNEDDAGGLRRFVTVYEEPYAQVDFRYQDEAQQIYKTIIGDIIKKDGKIFLNAGLISREVYENQEFVSYTQNRDPYLMLELTDGNERIHVKVAPESFVQDAFKEFEGDYGFSSGWIPGNPALAKFLLYRSSVSSPWMDKIKSGEYTCKVEWMESGSPEEKLVEGIGRGAGYIIRVYNENYDEIGQMAADEFITTVFERRNGVWKRL